MIDKKLGEIDKMILPEWTELDGNIDDYQFKYLILEALREIAEQLARIRSKMNS